MVKLELGQLVLRRMKEDDIEMVKDLIKEGSQGTENRLILHLLTRPLCLLLLATVSSVLRCLLHSFILALLVPVFLLIVYLKATMPRSTGVLGTSRPCWDYVGSSYRGEQDLALPNPYARISGKSQATKKAKRRKVPKQEEEAEAEPMDPERERAAGQVWLADWEGEVVGCVFREGERRPGVRRICRVVVSCWYRREGLGRLLVQSLEQRERETGARRLYAHVPYPSKMAEVFFRKLGYGLQGEGPFGEEEEEEEEERLEKPERALFGFQITKVFFKDLW